MATSCSSVVAVLGALLLASLGAPLNAQPQLIGTGLLGSTEEEVAKKLGPPDLKMTEYLNSMYLTTTRKPVAPVVKTVDFLWKKVKNDDKRTQDVFMAIGFDAKGVARTIRTDAGWVWTPKGMAEFCSAVATGWKNDKDASAVFVKHAVTGPQLFMSSQMVWQNSGAGVSFLKERPSVEMLGGQRSISGKAVSVSGDGRVYCAFDVTFDSNAPNSWSHGKFELCDAETFWSRALAELILDWKEGKDRGGSLGRSLPDKYAPNPNRPNLNDHFTQASYQLTAAVVAMVRNPGVDLKQVTLPVMILRDWPDPRSMNKLIDILKKDAPAVRARAAKMLALYQDTKAIEALLAALKDKVSVAAAATALKEIAGKDLGADPAAWQEWWKENSKTLQARFDAHLQEATGDLRVFSAGGKHYHFAECPLLPRTAARDFATLKQSRKVRTPCSTCNPPK